MQNSQNAFEKEKSGGCVQPGLKTSNKFIVIKMGQHCHKHRQTGLWDRKEVWEINLPNMIN